LVEQLPHCDLLRLILKTERFVMLAWQPSFSSLSKGYRVRGSLGLVQARGVPSGLLR
jgi:hypothetical protein